MKSLKSNKNLYILLAFILLGGLSSCSKWLDVKPEDKFLEEHLYSTPQGVAEIVNGFYVKLGTDALYGSNLSSTMLDVLAQRYRISSDKHPFYYYNNFSFAERVVENGIASVWTQMYNVIANINDMVRILPTVENGMTQDQKNQYIGEAIGLRAFIHFDLLRMFGKPYDETSKTEPAIPYYRNLTTDASPIESSEQIAAKILEDIAEAEKLLAKDPIITEGSMTNFNNNRFNIYAVKALKARVYQWINDKPAALAAAQEVIAAQDKFPWVSHSAITISGPNTDRKFFSENLFSVFNSKLNDLYNRYFNPNLLESEILSTSKDNIIEKVYENNTSDYRYVYLWPISTTGMRTFTKYLELSDTKNLSRFMVPVMRISEMYYIAAESSEDPKEGLSYLNTVRQHRNIMVDITNANSLRTELTKEYQKEFFGEGQLWYYYKRNKMTSIPTTNNAWRNMTIPLSHYQFKLPLVETTPR